MTRDEALALYHPIRASVRRILSAAVPVSPSSRIGAKTPTRHVLNQWFILCSRDNPKILR